MKEHGSNKTVDRSKVMYMNRMLKQYMSKNPLQDVFATEVPLLYNYFNVNTLSQARDASGSINYIKLYDLLSPNERAIFERLYDAFNRSRQRSIEETSWQMSKLESVRKIALKKRGSALLWKWISSLEHHLKANNTLSTHPELQPYEEALSRVGLSGLSHVVVEGMVKIIFFHGTLKANHFVATLASSIGRSIHEELSETLLKTRTLSRARSKWSGLYKMHRQYGTFFSQYKWTDSDKIKIGSAFLGIALDTLKIPVHNKLTQSKELKPAFWRTMIVRDGKKVGIVRPNEKLLEIMMRDDQLKELDQFTTKTFPMLVKPRPWTSFREGGLMYSGVRLLIERGPSPEITAYLHRAFEDHSLDPMVDALSTISCVAWSINPEILKVIIKIWQSGKELAGVPGLPMDAAKIDSTLSKREQFEQKYKLSQLRMNQRVERTTFGLMMSTAKSLAAKGDRFYLPLRIDFRGRCYPHTSTGLSHVGRDSVRGLFQFWYGKPLGSRGLWWLKVHVANMYGNDKISNDERVAFVENHLSSIEDSAMHPLDGKRWWLQADNPVQCLAACIELTNALKSESPKTYVSRLPINQDGSCNGLQHFAALGGDMEGASHVNMVGNQRPSDIYSRIAQIVAELVHQDATRGYEEAQKLDGRITRKVIKQPVMTSVYGVTMVGMIRQVSDKLEDIDSKTAAYLGRQIERAISELFSGAEMLKEWLEECAVKITHSVRADLYGPKIANDKEFLKGFTNAVVWTTPLGLPVVQPYRNFKSMVIRTQLQSIAIKNPFRFAFTDGRKQKQGITPNLIHSMDATHMLLTGRTCMEQGITFASVHDSFWTHACDVDRMSVILRQQFVGLYEQDVSGNLQRQFMQRYDGFMRLVQIDSNSEAGKRIRELRKTYELKSSNEVAILRYELTQEFYAWKAKKEHLNQQKGVECADFESDTTYKPDYESHYDSVLPSRILQQHPTPILENPSRGKSRHDDDDAIAASEDAGAQRSIGRRSYAFVRLFIPLDIPPAPARGKFDVKSVLTSPYFFS